MRLFFCVAAALILAAPSAFAKSDPACAFISADPPADPAHPAALYPFALPSGGVKINAALLTAAGAGAHPTVLLLHGFPGNEQNLDLAQAIRRCGWNVLTLHYRGAWGSPGQFSFKTVQEDGAAALAWLRAPDPAAAGKIDRSRIVVIGHSMGGWAAAFLGARDGGLLGTGLISAANMGAIGAAPRAGAIKIVDKNLGDSAGMRTLAATLQGLADELIAHSQDYDFTHLQGRLADHPLLLITSDDGLAGDSAALAATLQASGDRLITQTHLPTDHSYSDHRIALETAVIDWLVALPGARIGS